MMVTSKLTILFLPLLSAVVAQPGGLPSHYFNAETIKASQKGNQDTYTLVSLNTTGSVAMSEQQTTKSFSSAGGSLAHFWTADPTQPWSLTMQYQGQKTSSEPYHVRIHNDCQGKTCVPVKDTLNGWLGYGSPSRFCRGLFALDSCCGLDSHCRSVLCDPMTGLIKKSFDGCAGGTVKAPLNLAVITFPPAGCPLSPPNLKSVRYVAISNNLPKGKTKSTLKVSDQDGAAFACVDITLSNTADEDEKAASHLR